MPFPEGLTLVTVHCGVDSSRTPTVGRIRFEAPVTLLGPADNRVVTIQPASVLLDENGDGVIELPATNDPAWTPVDWSYVVTGSVDGVTFRGTLQLDHEQTDVQLADLLQLAQVPDDGVTYATLGQLNAALGDVATLPIGIDDVAGLEAALDDVPALPLAISDVADLTVQLDGKQPAGDYLTPSSIDNLVSSESLNEGLGLKLDKTGGAVTGTLSVVGPLSIGASGVLNVGADTNLYRAGPSQLATDDDFAAGGNLRVYGSAQIDGSLNGTQIINSTLVIRKADWSAALRFRSTGGAVDIDLAGTVVISSFAGIPEDVFGGTQTGLMRLRAGSGVTLAGLTEFGQNEYGGQQQIDAAGGTANLGAKNGATNLKLGGFLDIAGAPTAGTWATGDVVMTRTGIYRCSAGGTPGTWTLYTTDQGFFHASDAGYSAWSYDPSQTQAGLILPTGGLSFIVRLRLMASTISAINLHLTVPGAGLTNAFATVHTDAGVKLGATAVTTNQSTNLQTAGERTMPLAAVQNVIPGNFYKIRFWVTGTTLPTLSRACNSASAIVNAGLGSPNFRWATADGGLTDAASAPDTIGALTGGQTAWWLAVKP
jgi:hypothetical protein